MYYIVNLILV
jgi:hypothetical protein